MRIGRVKVKEEECEEPAADAEEDEGSVDGESAGDAIMVLTDEGGQRLLLRRVRRSWWSSFTVGGAPCC